MMQHTPRPRWIRRVLAIVVMAGVTLCCQKTGQTAEKGAIDPAAVERARDNVRMLDDVYKGFVVNITATYVKAQELTPAARVTQKVFKHMEAKGWHAARLVDATGNPVNPANLPRKGFETRAVKKIKDGQTYYEEVATVRGHPVLRAATIVP
ncbi:MAG TPA: hypothetical protein VFA18_16565, partial [Gemmataceae bacterium]|nr:hypothetical protein [Gemmataceae bacterium]